MTDKDKAMGENRLVEREEIGIYARQKGITLNSPDEWKAAVALMCQRDLTALIKDAKCRKRVERIFEEIENGIYALELELRIEDLTALMGLIVALKEQEGIE